jgi:hypothetical protein
VPPYVFCADEVPLFERVEKVARALHAVFLINDISPRDMIYAGGV